MPTTQIRLRHTLPVLALTAAFAVGCGGETTDISAAVDDTNKNLQGAAKLDCADEIDGGEGTKFDCTLKGTKSGKTETVNLKIEKDGIAPVDEKDYVAALQKVAG
ncbi:MAG TPA: hypothetical protein VFY44_04610 [Thermoleophilaceae bacterium]|nr:hypothetical protein [Thermoleophilaceae bacterium]